MLQKIREIEQKLNILASYKNHITAGGNARFNTEDLENDIQKRIQRLNDELTLVVSQFETIKTAAKKVLTDYAH